VDGVDSDVSKGVADIDGSKHCYTEEEKVRVSFNGLPRGPKALMFNRFESSNEVLFESRRSMLMLVA
jgi:hypothetical protein